MQTLVFLSALWTGALCFTCLDYNSNQVDWYTVYKVPKIQRSSDIKVKEGLAHFYLDVNSPVWSLSGRRMNESQQAVYETLSTFYKNKNADSMYIIYNDEPPSHASTNEMGHTKGVVFFDKNNGFWLVHSVPHFPPVQSAGYSWPSTALEYGQSFLCVSFSYNTLGNIATQLLYNEPTIYDSYVSDSILHDFPLLNDVIKGVKPKGPSWSNVIQLNSLGGQKFTSFAKSGKFGADLYDALIAPTLQQNLQVETWLNGQGGKLDSNCSAKYKVFKITEISLPGDNLVFNETKDHSKWAVSYSLTVERVKFILSFNTFEKWTCIGDINRMTSQFSRGGGSLCLQHSAVWAAYSSSVKSFDRC